MGVPRLGKKLYEPAFHFGKAPSPYSGKSLKLQTPRGFDTMGADLGKSRLGPANSKNFAVCSAADQPLASAPENLVFNGQFADLDVWQIGLPSPVATPERLKSACHRKIQVVTALQDARSTWAAAEDRMYLRRFTPARRFRATNRRCGSERNGCG